MLALVDLLLVGDDPNQQILLWLDGRLGVESRNGFDLAADLDKIWEELLWLNASITEYRWAVTLFIYTLTFTLKPMKSTKNVTLAEQCWVLHVAST
jgi:hypothetical protein